MDAHAWIEYLDGTTRGAMVRDILEDTKNTITTSTVTFAEVLSKALQTRRDSKITIAAIESNSTLQPVNTPLAMLAGEIHAEEKRKKPDFGLADAFVLATARSKSFKVLTGDHHFHDIPEATMI